MTLPLPKHEYRQQHVLAVNASSQSVAHYAKKHGINIDQLYYWRSTIAKRNKNKHSGENKRESNKVFKQVAVIPKENTTDLILLFKGAVLKFPTLPCASWLHALLNVSSESS
jgi:transposase-like protein